ncbi:MAG: hypothetical protein K2J06_00690 [Muribaculaceae bacterium]|nr:hypothetical protein [Muribaculaceae bacterium]
MSQRLRRARASSHSNAITPSTTATLGSDGDSTLDLSALTAVTVAVSLTVAATSLLDCSSTESTAAARPLISARRALTVTRRPEESARISI